MPGPSEHGPPTKATILAPVPKKQAPSSPIATLKATPVQLAREIGLGDGVVVKREVVKLETERADPDLGGEVDASERVESGGAGA